MNYSKVKTIAYIILLFTLIFYYSIFAQPKAVAAVHYTQISSFEIDYYIADMKMSADGSKIIFATGGPQVKIFTINTNGTGLIQVYDFQTTGTAPFIDISSDGDKVIWCDRYGEIFVANSDGTARYEIATWLPNPDTTRADLEPIIPLPPRITVDGGTVFFMNVDRDARVSGVWSINTNNTNLTQIFNYIDVATQVYGRDGSEYNYNTAFADGFDINGDGSRIIFGTKTFKLEEGDPDRGDAIVAYGTTFYELCDYAVGNQPFSTNMDDDVYLVFKKEFNPDIQFDEINVYFQPLGTGDPIKVISGIDHAGTARMTQISANGSTGIVYGANGRLPITLVNRVPGSHLDLVSIDGISRDIGGFNFSESAYPSINGDGDKFCFLANSIPTQIWIGDILSDAVASEPKISGIKFTPNYVFHDRSTTATIEAYVSDINDPIHLVTFEAVQDGSVFFRALMAEGGAPFNPSLFDDGSYGDQSMGDHYYTNNTVQRDLQGTPLGDYGIRIAAANTSLRKVTMVDAETFSIVDETTGINGNEILPEDFILHQNHPNPFNPSTVINYSIKNHCFVTLKVFDVLGRELRTLVKKEQSVGNYKVEFNASNLTSGIYFYRIQAGQFVVSKKMTLLK